MTLSPRCAPGWRRRWLSTPAVWKCGSLWLRAYETKKMLSRIKPDVPIEEGEEDEDEDFEGYWLLERGWDYDTEALKKTLR